MDFIMVEQNWQLPLLFDWAGENGPPLTEEDLYNSEIARILRNDFHPPFHDVEYVRVKPWWNPRDPYGINDNYIPGKQKIPLYPRLSNLTKQQHLSGLKALSCEYRIDPWNYPSPKPKDFVTFDNIEHIYKKEQKEYRLWARKRWVDGDCVRTLHPKPLLETVYEAQFELKKLEINTLPHEFTMTAQILLEPRERNASEFQPLKNLKSVDINNLPTISYPKRIELDISLMEHYEVPVPCRQHPTRFILPDENTVTTLTLPEVNKQLAHFAMKNGATLIASEKALQCLLDSEQDWKLPVSVEEVVFPGGGVETVVVMGSELIVQKECGAMRTYRAFKHLLRNKFTKPNEIYDPNVEDEDELQTDDPEQRRQSTKSPCPPSPDLTNNSNAASDAGFSRFNSEHIRSSIMNQLRSFCTKTESKSKVSVTDGGGRDEGAGVSGTDPKGAKIKSYPHLGNTLTKSTENSDLNLPTHQPATVEDTNHSISSDKYVVQPVDAVDQRPPWTNNASGFNFSTININAPSDAGCSNSEPPRVTTNRFGTSSTETEWEAEVSDLDGGGRDEGAGVSGTDPKGAKIKSYTHLGNTLTNSTENSDLNLPTHEPATVENTNDSNSSDTDVVQSVDAIDQRPRWTKNAAGSYFVTKNINAPSDAGCSYSEPPRVTTNQFGMSSTETEWEPEVSDLDGGGRGDEVVVFDSAPNECSTCKCYRHLLEKTFAKSTENSDLNLPTHEPATVEDTNDSNSSDKDVVQPVDAIDQRPRWTKNAVGSYFVTKNINAPSDAGCSNSEPPRVTTNQFGMCSTETEWEPEVSDLDGGGRGDEVVVFDSAPNECSTCKCYRHLIEKTFAKSTENSDLNLSTHEPATVEDTNDSNSSDKDVVQPVDAIDQRPRWTKNAAGSYFVTKNINAPSDAGCSNSEPPRVTTNQFGMSSTETEWEPEVSDLDGVGRGDVVVVFGSAPNECGTFKSYRHLLANTYPKSSDNLETNLPTQQPDTVKDTDVFYSRDANQSNSCYEDERQMNINEQRRGSTESAPVSYYDSDALSDAEMSSCSSEPNNQSYSSYEDERQMNINEQRRGSTESAPVSYYSDAPSDEEMSSYSSEPNNESYSSYEDERQMNINKQRRGSTESAPVSYYSDAPSDAEMSSCSSEPNRLTIDDHLSHSTDNSREAKRSYSTYEEEQQININEQRQGSTESAPVSDCDNNSSDAPIDAEISSSSESMRLTIDDHLSFSSKDIELESEVSVPVKLEAEIEVPVPHEEQKRINFAGICTGTDEAQTSDQFSFDTTTLQEAINDIIIENLSSKEDTDDINCTCKGTTFEVPPPRSFKKWQVKNAASNRSFDLIVHSSHKVRLDNTEMILEPIVEWQPELGACKQSAGRLRALALALMMRPKAELMNVRLDYKNGNIIVIDRLCEETFTRWHGDKRSEIADRIYAAIDQLRLLKPGQYILAHDPRQGAHAIVYSALAEPAGAAGAHTISLRPDNYNLSDAQEADLSKNVCLELSRAMLPYHKSQGILPLAFTPDKNRVKTSNNGTPALVQPREPSQAAIQPEGAAGRSKPEGASGRSKWRKNKKKKKKRHHH